MGRKKKEKEIINYEPSSYQKAIFDFIEKGQGNLVVSAAAGSGKSYTLIHSLNLIPEDKRILFCAFNREIVKELQKKIENKGNIEIRTVHGLGYAIVNKFFNSFTPINENKYRQEIYNNISNYTTHSFRTLGKKLFNKYIDNVIKMCDYFRYNMIYSEKDSDVIIKRYDIEIIDDEIETTFKLLEWGKEHIEEIDYTDMVWLPNILRMPVQGFQYDFIMVDEAQDISICQRELLLKCKKINTRYIFVGDSDQAIYSFASASPEMFKSLQDLPNTTSLPLSISYRCADKIVEFAQKVVPTIEKNADNREGNILYDLDLDVVNDGDMVLCRNNAPLTKAYAELISIGRKCYIRGKDIGKNLVNLVKKTDYKDLNIDLRYNGVFSELYLDLFNTRNAMMKETSLHRAEVMNTSIMQNKYDMIKSLEILAEGCKDASALIEKITEIFSDKTKEGVSLSTIHKAKGLEADNVYIVMPSLMPSKSAKQDWEIIQEQNLKYVAYTRAKNTLGFIKESIFDSLGVGNTESLELIEKRVNMLYGNVSAPIVEKVTADNYREVLKQIKPITMTPMRSKMVSKNTGLAGAMTMNSLLQKKQQIKKIR